MLTERTAKLPRRRFTRRLLAGAAIGSLILCLATVGLWVRSYFIKDEITGLPSSGWMKLVPARQWTIVSGKDGLGIYRVDRHLRNKPGPVPQPVSEWLWTTSAAQNLHHGL